MAAFPRSIASSVPISIVWSCTHQFTDHWKTSSHFPISYKDGSLNQIDIKWMICARSLFVGEMQRSVSHANQVFCTIILSKANTSTSPHLALLLRFVRPTLHLTLALQTPPPPGPAATQKWTQILHSTHICSASVAKGKALMLQNCRRKDPPRFAWLWQTSLVRPSSMSRSYVPVTANDFSQDSSCPSLKNSPLPRLQGYDRSRSSITYR